jgi:hypothetical protein
MRLISGQIEARGVREAALGDPVENVGVDLSCTAGIGGYNTCLTEVLWRQVSAQALWGRLLPEEN